MNVRASLDIVIQRYYFSCSGYYINYCNIIATFTLRYVGLDIAFFIVFITGF